MASNKRARDVFETVNECTVCTDHPSARITGVVCDDCVVNMKQKDFNLMVQQKRYVHEDDQLHYNANQGIWYDNREILDEKRPLCFSDEELNRMKRLRKASKDKKKLDRTTQMKVKKNQQTSMKNFFNPK